MRFEKIGKWYFVNGQRVSLNALAAIFCEIWNYEEFSKLHELILDGGIDVDGWNCHLITSEDQANQQATARQKLESQLAELQKTVDEIAKV